MKKLTFLLILSLMTLLLVFTSCGHEHEYGEWQTTKPMTCTENGIRERTCSSCGAKETTPIITTGEHQYVEEVVKKATCINDGLISATCHLCNDTFTKVVKATGKHQYITEITHEATCSAEGIKKHTCTDCNDTYTETFTAEHLWKEATCTEPKSCIKCDTISGEALGHTTSGLTCSRCGEKIFETLTYHGMGNKVITNISLPKGSFILRAQYSDPTAAVSLCRVYLRRYNSEESYRASVIVSAKGDHSDQITFRVKDEDIGNYFYLDISTESSNSWTITIEAIG